MVSVVVTVDCLKSWHSLLEENEVMDHDCYEAKVKPDAAAQFELHQDINSKVYLWCGNAVNLAMGCIIIPFNDTLYEVSNAGKTFCAAAGCEFKNQLKEAEELQGMRTGSVGCTKGCALQCKNVVYVSEPHVGIKFTSDLETALHNCYRGALQMSAERHWRSVAITKLYRTDVAELSRHAAHTAVRTIRCCLQNLSAEFDAVVVVVEEHDMELYSRLFSTYFPRSVRESCQEIPCFGARSLGLWGDLVYPEREIRITDLISTQPETEDDLSESSSDSTDAGVVPGAIGNHSFTKMSGDHDQKRKSQLRVINRREMIRTQERIYTRLLRLARTTDLSSIAATNALYVCGQDHDGSPVVVLVAKYMNIPNLDLDKALLYFIHLLDSVVKKRYSIVYFHTMSQPNNRIPSDFLRKAYNTVDQRYKSNLKYIYIVHPTFWSKLFTYVFATLNASDLKKQIMFVGNIPQIYQFISSDQIDIPRFVINYDLQANRGFYNTVKRSNSLPPRRTSDLSAMSTASNM